MSTEVQTSEKDQQVAAPETKSLAQVADEVVADSSQQPRVYLDQTTVPHGGE